MATTLYFVLCFKTPNEVDHCLTKNSSCTKPRFHGKRIHITQENVSAKEVTC